jgi:hypothetical protein
MSREPETRYAKSGERSVGPELRQLVRQQVIEVVQRYGNPGS